MAHPAVRLFDKTKEAFLSREQAATNHNIPPRTGNPGL